MENSGKPATRLNVTYHGRKAWCQGAWLHRIEGPAYVTFGSYYWYRMGTRFYEHKQYANEEKTQSD